MAQVTEMFRVINFVLETKTLGLRLVPIFNDGVWKLEALSDSDFANDKNTRYSVYGYIIYFCGVPKRCHTFWNRNILLLPIVLGKVSCVPATTLCELYGVKF